MKLGKYVSTASAVCTMSLGFAGSAFAADTVTFDTTGADSNQKVEINNSSEVNVHNTNNVVVVNANFQKAESGDIDANRNTSITGDVATGDASNDNSTTTTVNVSNESAAEVPTGGSGNGGGGAVGGSGNGGGSVQGASTVGGMGAGVATLPEVGASVPMDVSALRAAWHPQSNAQAAVLAKGSQMFTGLMLLTATLLSIIGAIGSAWYAKRQERV